MKILEEAIKNNDLKKISELYDNNLINKEDNYTYNIIKKILYKDIKHGTVKNKQELDKDNILIRLIIEKTNYYLDYSPKNNKPILYNILMVNNKELSLYVTERLTDKEIEKSINMGFDIQKNSILDITDKKNFYSSLDIAIRKKNSLFLNYVLDKRKILEKEPFFYKIIPNSNDTHISDFLVFLENKNENKNEKKHAVKTSIIKELISFKKLTLNLSETDYLKKISNEEKIDLLKEYISSKYNLSKFEYLSEQFLSDKISINYNILLDTISRNIEDINKKIKLTIYKKILLQLDPLITNKKNITMLALNYNAHNLLKFLIDNNKIKREKLIFCLENFFDPGLNILSLKRFQANSYKDKDKYISLELAESINILLENKIIYPEDILSNKKIFEKVKEYPFIITIIEKHSLLSNVEENKKQLNVSKKRL